MYYFSLFGGAACCVGGEQIFSIDGSGKDKGSKDLKLPLLCTNMEGI